VFVQAKAFGKGYNLVVAAVFGGMNKHEQVDLPAKSAWDKM